LVIRGVMERLTAASKSANSSFHIMRGRRTLREVGLRRRGGSIGDSRGDDSVNLCRCRWSRWRIRPRLRDRREQRFILGLVIPQP
jgi:hypothetical protein